MKRIKVKATGIILMLLTAMIISLVGCGSDKSAADDPNLGTYVATSAEMMGIEVGVEDIFEGGFTFELKKKGKAKVTFDGDSGNVKWTLEDGKFHAEGEGAEFDGTVKDGVMVLEDIMGSGVTLTLKCDEIIAKGGAGGDDKTVSSGKFGDSDDKKESSDADSLYGKYDAITAIDSEGEFWLNEGEYLTVNNDGTISMYVGEQDLEYDTSIENNNFYLNGDTRVGQINDDGTITLFLNDEVKYIFAKKGTDQWNEWAEHMGVGSGSSDSAEGSLGAGNFGAVDITGGSGSGKPDVNYDFDEALKLVGDYEGFMIFKKGAKCYGRSFDGITGDAYARIVIDQKGEPQVYIRHIYGESINVEHVKGQFDEDGWLRLVGMMGTDNGPVEWTSILKPAVGDEPLCISAVLTSDYETPLFDFYMKPLGAKWDYSYLDGEITEKDFYAYVNNMGASDTGVLEDDLQVMQDFWSKNSKVDDPIKMVTDELPDPKLLHLYK